MATTIEGVDFSAQITRLLALETWRNNRVEGFLSSPPTTASTQASGAVAPAWRVNRAPGVARHAGDLSAKPVGSSNLTDFDVTAAAGVGALAIGQSVIVCLVWCHIYAGTISIKTVKGTPATTGQQLAPTDTQIRTVIAGFYPSDTSYVRESKLTLNRTGDTTVTQSQDNTWRDF